MHNVTKRKHIFEYFTQKCIIFAFMNEAVSLFFIHQHAWCDVFDIINADKF